MGPTFQASLPGLGRSPDGIGAYLTEPGGAPVERTPTSLYYPSPIGAELPMEPTDTSTLAAVQSAGFTALFVALGTAVGLGLGGGLGAGAGLMLSGAAVNGYRAQKWMNDADPGRRHEAVVSATVGVFEVVIGGYLVWKARAAKRGS